MDAFAQHKDDIYDQIAQLIIAQYDQGTLEYSETKEISDYVISGMKEVNNERSLISFLGDLSFNWNMFQPLLAIEKSKVQEFQEKKTAVQVADLIESGNTQVAVNTAEKAMDQDA